MREDLGVIMRENIELVDIRCKAGQLLARVDNKAVQGVLEFKCKRCNKIHKFKEGKEVEK